MMFWAKHTIEKLRQKGDAHGLFRIAYRDKKLDNAQLAMHAMATLNNESVLILLHNAIKSTQEDIRTIALRVMMQSPHTLFLPLLRKALADESVAIRRLAIAAMGATGTIAEIEPLLVFVTVPGREEQSDVLDALVAIGKRLTVAERTHHIIVPLGNILHETRINRKDVGVQTLEWMGWEPDIPLPTDAERAAHNVALRTAILAALEQLGWQPDQSHIAAEYWIAHDNWDACVAIGEPAVDVLIAIFKGDDEAIRQKAYYALVQIGEVAAQRLNEVLENDIADMRLAAFRALAKLGEKAVPQMVTALQDTDSNIRLAAVQSLGTLGLKHTIPSLIDAFGDTDPAVRREAYHAVLAMGEQAIPAVQRAVRFDTNQEVRWVAARTLDALGWQPSTDKVSAAYWIVRGQWNRCIAIGTPAIPVLVAMLDHWDKEMCMKSIYSLLRIGNDGITAFISTICRKPATIRRCSVSFLETMAGSYMPYQHIASIMQALLAREEDDAVAHHMVAALQHMQQRQLRQQGTKKKSMTSPAADETYYMDQIDYSASRLVV